jgi:DNA polymerase-3 subunit alpha
MSKKKHKVMEEERTFFLDGCLKNGIENNVANEIFDDMSSFASYAFNKSHAAAYAVVAYRTAYLKYYYPCEFMASLLTSVLDNSAKISDYIDACKKNGINILPPNVNVSNKTFTVGEDNKTVMFGLLAIKNLGHDFIDTIINERRLNGKFTSFYSFCKRVHGKGFNRRAVEGLIKSGALDGLGSNRQEMLMNLPDVIDDLDSSRRRNIEGQIGFFDLISNDSSSSEFVMKKIDEFPSHTMLMMEKETTGLYISSHPMEQYKELANKLKCDTIGDILNADNDFNSKYVDSFSVKIMGIINGITRKQTKAGDTMAFVTLEDVNGSVEVIIFPKLFAKYSNILYNGNILMIGGRLSVREEESPKIILDFAESAENVKSNQTKKSGLFIRVENETCSIYARCNEIISDAKAGDIPLYFYFANSKKYFPCKKISLDDITLVQLNAIAGEQNVILQK